MQPHDCLEETSISLSSAAPEPPERRVGQRHVTILRVAAVVIDGVRELCLVRNISAGGVMLHLYREVALGTQIAVEIKNDELMSGKVVWAREANVGVAFDQQIDVPELLASSKLLGDGRRARRPRIEVDRSARLRCGSDVLWTRVRDVSQGGVKLDVDRALPIDADAVVTLEGFRPLAGIVRWQKDGSVGVSFLQVIPVGELCDWLRATPAADQPRVGAA